MVVPIDSSQKPRTPSRSHHNTPQKPVFLQRNPDDPYPRQTAGIAASAADLKLNS
jgi:hypothetical protein